ncbi:MAG: diadenylate cyclase CdaA [Spirochaetota bacterium]|nr:diadenylate cyclase CdaA [Spirochaetota bacterium]
MEIAIDKFLDIIIVFWNYFKNILDILIVAVIFYWAYTLLSNTRAVQLIKGFVIIIIFAIMSRLLGFVTVNWLITNLTSYVVISIIILFQPELRRLLTQFGQRNWISSAISNDILPLDELVNSIIAMSEERVGSIIVIQRNTGLRVYIESGVLINSTVSEELIRTIFFPNTQLHDGAIIIQQGRISAAACYLPLSNNTRQLKKFHGARHRAGLGMAEETDALIAVTSEETGDISIMANGRMHSKVKVANLKNMILFFLNPKTAYEEKYSIK